MSELRCKSCGEPWFMKFGDELCKDCRAWQVSQTPAAIKTQLEAKKRQEEKRKKYLQVAR